RPKGGVAEVIVRGEIDAAGRHQRTIAPCGTQRVESSRPTLQKLHDSLGTPAGSPIARNRSSSASAAGLGAVSSFSPKKIELAPARKHNTCSSRLMRSRPALSRTRALGNVMRV